MKTERILEHTDLPGVLWLPEGDCRMVLQVVHGMTEHLDRYRDLGECLTRQGIALAGFDLPGHGQNPGDPVCASLGEQGWTRTLRQLDALHAALSQRLPGVPQALMGFSLGSFLVRDYVRTCEEKPEKLIVMGSGAQPGVLLAMLKALVKGQIRKAGFDRTTDLVRNLSFGAYNQKFRPNRTQADWLCGDPEQLDDYLADPLCRKEISAGLFWQLLDGMQRTGADPYTTWNREMPVLLISGGADPVGSFG